MRKRSAITSSATARYIGILVGAGLLSGLAAAAVTQAHAALNGLASVGIADLSSLQEGSRIYAEACSTCHGAHGAGRSSSELGFGASTPDFTDCSFAPREATADWVAVAHDGGPVRGFSHFMPAFGKALTETQLKAAIRHIRTFCDNEAWPRGELNLPRGLVTTKAFPEDEVVVAANIATEGPDSFVLETIYEKRFGPRNQVEVALPFGWREAPDSTGSSDRRAVLGDVALGFKRVLYSDFRRGTIVSGAAEVILPTGDDASGFSNDTVVAEPMLLVGQLLPRGYFLQGQVGLGLSFDEDKTENEAFWRMLVGRAINEGRWGRRWAPMIEVTGARALSGGADTDWDAVPQLQITLNTRQHVRLALGARVPLNRTDERDTVVQMYVLWDFFDGGLTEGW